MRDGIDNDEVMMMRADHLPSESIQHFGEKLIPFLPIPLELME